MRTEKEQKQIIAMMFMEMFLDGDKRGLQLIEASHSYVQSSVMSVPVTDAALNLYASIKTDAIIEGMRNDN